MSSHASFLPSQSPVRNPTDLPADSCPTLNGQVCADAAQSPCAAQYCSGPGFDEEACLAEAYGSSCLAASCKARQHAPHLRVPGTRVLYRLTHGLVRLHNAVICITSLCVTAWLLTYIDMIGLAWKASILEKQFHLSNPMRELLLGWTLLEPGYLWKHVAEGCMR